MTKQNQQALTATEMEELAKKRDANIGMAHSATRAADMLDLAGIFVMNSTESFKILFENLARFIMLPFAGAGAIAVTGFSWAEWAYNRKKKGNQVLLSNAIVETIAAALINAAVIGGLSFSTFTVGPLLFSIALGVKAIHSLGKGIYYLVQAYKHAGDPGNKENVRKFRDAFISFAISGLACAGVVAAMIFMQAKLTMLGIVAGAVGAAFGIFKTIEIGCNKPRAKKVNGAQYRRITAEATEQPAPAPGLTNGADLAASLGASASTSVAASAAQAARARRRSSVVADVHQQLFDGHHVTPATVYEPPVDYDRASVRRRNI